ncbi:MAG: polyprenyl synthetase family protein, partial [Planktomarina sp.]|nr:polyprenyl synthetase family protein [Planktomarina sp.]
MSNKQDVRVMAGQPDKMTALLTSADPDLVDELLPMTDILHSFILARLPEPDTPLADAALHHFSIPGKMVRAKMALRAANLLKIDVTAALHWAVAIEVLHNASLIH